jgi:hypothetical protein
LLSKDEARRLGASFSKSAKAFRAAAGLYHDTEVLPPSTTARNIVNIGLQRPTQPPDGSSLAPSEKPEKSPNAAIAKGAREIPAFCFAPPAGGARAPPGRMACV